MFLERTNVMVVVMLLFSSLFGMVFESIGEVTEQIAVSIDGCSTCGNGTEEDSYLIYDVYDLQAMRDDLEAHYALANDIDASETVEWNDGAGFEPVGKYVWDDPSASFTGSFDGRNHTITGLYINRSETSYIGLFGHIDFLGMVKNVGVLNNNFTGYRYVGGLAGGNIGTISNSYTSGDVSGDKNIGGLVGYHTGAVSYSHAMGNVNGDWNVGGLTGLNEGGKVYDSYAIVTVSGGTNVGGFTGYNWGRVENSYATGNVNGNNNVGGLVGRDSGKVTNSYAEGHINGVSGVGGLVGLYSRGSITNSHYNIEEVLINGDHHVTLGGLFYDQYHDWFDSGFTLDISDYSDTLVPSGDHYEISCADGLRDLLGFADRGGYKFHLTADIDLSGEPGLYIPFLAADFFGNNYTISNLHIDMPFAAYVGMFGYVYNSVILDIRVVDAEVSGDWRVGGLIGSGGTVSNSYATGVVSGDKDVGGLIGSGGTVDNSYSTANVSGDERVGGLVGTNGGTIENSYATGYVDGGDSVGGLVGYNGGTIENSYATGHVDGGDRVGGMAGWNSGCLGNSYAAGDIMGTSSVGGLVGYQFNGLIENSFATGNTIGNEQVGGLVGGNFHEGIISGSYATGNTTGDRYVGGLVGFNHYHYGTILNSFSTGATIGNEIVGGLVGYNEGTVLTSYAMGDTIGNRTVGGLVGENNNYGKIYNSYSNGTVVRATNLINTDIGGFVGFNDQGRITNSYSIGRVTYENESDPTDKGFAGNVNTGGNYEMTGNFWDIETSGQDSTSGDATGKSTEEMKTESTFTDAGWDFKFTWFMEEGVTYPLHFWQIGNGTVDNPFLIYDVWDLQDMNMNTYAHYALANDIDAAITSEWNDGAGFIPVGKDVFLEYSASFRGVLDGRDHVITNLHINRPNTDKIGLFGYIGSEGEVRNVGVVDTVVRGDGDVGGLVGENRGTVFNTYVTGEIHGQDVVGGLVGFNWDGTVNNSYATVTVSGGSRVGGLVGMNHGIVVNSHVTGSVNGYDWVGALVGRDWSTISNSFYNIDDVLINSGHHITRGALFPEQYQDWINNDFYLNISDYSDTLIPSGDYYEIGSVDGLRDLLGFADRSEYKFRLSSCIDISTAPGLYIPYLRGDFDGNNHTIMNLKIHQTFGRNLGMFGSTHYRATIQYLEVINIDVMGSQYVGGLVGYNLGTILNSYTTGDANVSGNEYVGGLVGENRGMISDSFATGTVEGGYWIGGLVGYNWWGTVSNSYMVGDITGNYYVGGVVGYNGGTVDNSYAAGNVSGNTAVGGLVGCNIANRAIGIISNSHATGNVSGSDHIGGLVGLNDLGGTVSNSFATGSVTGGGSGVGGLMGTNNRGIVEKTYATGDVVGGLSVGGLVGINYGDISSAFASGNVTGSEYVGGFVGVNYWLSVSDSYATGNVIRASGSTGVSFGGFVGLNDQGRINRCYSIGCVRYEDTTDPTDKGFAGTVDIGSSYEMHGNFWDIDASGQSDTAGNATGKTTAAMLYSSPYSDEDWDIVAVDRIDARNIVYTWNIVDAYTYPFLSWQDNVIPPEFTLEIHAEGNGTTNPLVGNHTYNYGQEAIIVAIPATGWVFSHWSGDVPEGEEHNQEITIVMDSGKTITAHFLRKEYTLEISVEGGGVTDPTVGTHLYDHGAEVTITTIPATGWRFSHWSGDVPEGEEENEEITIVMDGDKTVTAHFVRHEFNLNITVDGEGTTDPAPGNHIYEYQDEITVIATPAEGWRFSHWSGDVESTNETITIFMDGDKTVVAHFERQEFSLNISVEGEGTTSPSVGVHPYLYEYGATVTAMPAEGWRFSHWSGDIDSTNETVAIFMDGNKNITANFEEMLFIPDDLELIVTPVGGDSPLNVTITVRGDNVGLLNGSVDVMVDDIVAHTILIPAGERAEHTFNHTFQEQGNYTISFDNLSETVIVSEPDEVKPSSIEDNFTSLLIIAMIAVVILLVLFKKRLSKTASQDIQESAPEDEVLSVEDEIHPEDDTDL